MDAPAPRELRVSVNGERRSIPAGTSVTDLLISLQLSDKTCAVELNREIVPRSAHRERTLAEGDRVEIVSFVGGG